VAIYAHQHAEAFAPNTADSSARGASVQLQQASPKSKHAARRPVALARPPLNSSTPNQPNTRPHALPAARTSSRATRRAPGTTSSAASGGTATGCRWSTRSTRSWVGEGAGWTAVGSVAAVGVFGERPVVGRSGPVGSAAPYQGTPAGLFTAQALTVERAPDDSPPRPPTPPHRTPDPPPGVKTRDDVLAMGIDVYNEECRSIVMRWGWGGGGGVGEALICRGVRYSAGTVTPRNAPTLHPPMPQVLEAVGGDREAPRPLDRL
jgi:hypothetical protein